MERFYTGWIVAGFGQVGYLIGAYAGICIQYRCFNGLSLIQPPRKKKCLKGFLRNLMLGIFALSYQWGHARWVFGSNANIYILLFFHQLVPSFVLFLLIFGFSDALFLKIGLYDLMADDVVLTISDDMGRSEVLEVKPTASKVDKESCASSI